MIDQIDPPAPQPNSTLASSLLVRVQVHDPEAWRRLVVIYSPLVYGWCRQSNLQPNDAMDVVQNVLAAVAMAIGRFRRDRQGDSFRGWLRTITRNQIRDHVRAGAFRPKAVGGSNAQERIAQLPDWADDDEDDECAANEMSGVMRRALDCVRTEFAEKTWAAFWRTTVDGQLPADVADALGMTVGAVYKAKSRVLARLRAELAGGSRRRARP